MATLSLAISPPSPTPFASSSPSSSLIIQCCSNKNISRDNSSHRELHFPTNGKPASFEQSSILKGSSPLPPQPRCIILVRHGESEGNMDENMYTRVGDPKIGLTQKGKAQAEERGAKIREMIEGNGAAEDWKVYFYVSPYKRTRQTLQHLGRCFERRRIAGVREEPRLREQDFGNFQDRERMRVEKALRMLYGRFFFRFPNGESAADVYDRITGFRETLKSDIDMGRFQPSGQRRSEDINLVIVSHGVTLRVFLMRWYKWTVEQYERLHNLGNAGMVVMEKGYGGRYSLLMHHSEDEMRKFGLTEDMLIDQHWQKHARPGELNYDCPTINSFFTHLGVGDDGCIN